mmetsp:Transcript_19364/g.56620  ORF Transcript_19364/g.56620 Transcript_19364/m.56620 type:complete len:262 (+) Transcript_19364:2158-2943(+)
MEVVPEDPGQPVVPEAEVHRGEASSRIPRDPAYHTGPAEEGLPIRGEDRSKDPSAEEGGRRKGPSVACRPTWRGEAERSCPDLGRRRPRGSFRPCRGAGVSNPWDCPLRQRLQRRWPRAARENLASVDRHGRSRWRTGWERRTYDSTPRAAVELGRVDAESPGWSPPAAVSAECEAPPRTPPLEEEGDDGAGLLLLRTEREALEGLQGHPEEEEGRPVSTGRLAAAVQMSYWPGKLCFRRLTVRCRCPYRRGGITKGVANR